MKPCHEDEEGATNQAITRLVSPVQVPESHHHQRLTGTVKV